VLELYHVLCRDGDYAYCAFAQAYLYSFSMIFIVVVLNVFIFIIETGYSKAQRTTGSHDEAPVMLDHDRLHRVLEAAEKTVPINSDAHDQSSYVNSVFEMDNMDEETASLIGSTDSLASLATSPSDATMSRGNNSGRVYEADDDEPLLDVDDTGDAEGTPRAASTEVSLQIEEIVRAAVEECTRKVLATQRAAGPGGELRDMETEGADALLAENAMLRDELAHKRKLVELLKRDLATLSGAVANLRRARESEPMQHWSVING